MTVRKCSTCKHYEPAPIWRKGWCRNPLLYSPQQSHLVGEDDLDCDRGMGNYWEPLDADDSEMAAGPTREVAAVGDAWQARQEFGANEAPLRFMPARSPHGEDRTAGGGDMSQYSGPGRRGNGDDDDEEFRRPPVTGDRSRSPLQGGPERQFTYYTEERYWTDYLRIAAPVIGVILMLGLAWFWINNLLGDKSNNNTGQQSNGAPVVITGSPTSSAAGITGTPRPLATATGSAGAATPGPGGQITVGSKVVVGNTGGSGVNMRSEPSTSGKIVAMLPDGTQLEVTGQAVTADNYTWWPVKSANQSGYVVQDYLKPAP